MNEDAIKEQLGEAGDKTKVWNCFDYERDGIIEASAGTGKTYTLQSIVLKLLVEKRVESVTNLLLVTFTEKAAGELKDRIRQILEKAEMLPPDFDEVTICTIHAFCRELLSEYAFENGVPMAMEIGGSDADLIHRAVRTTLLGKKFEEKYGATFKDKGKIGQIASADELVAKAQEVLGEKKAKKAKAIGGEESQGIVNDLVEWSRDEVERLKAEAFLLTYDDLITKANEVIQCEAAREAEGEKSTLLESIRRRYRIALVDEFQDTNAMQWNIFKSIFSSRVNKLEGDDAPRPRQGFLLVVGDPKQAIYGFQGADIATYLKARNEICEGQERQSLSFTYRSSKELVSAFNIFFGKGTSWFKGMGAGDSTIEYEPVEYPEGNKRFKGYENKTGRGVVTLLEALPQGVELPGSTRGGYGNAKTCVPVFARNAAREMKYLYSLPEGNGRRIEYKDMCVLVRGQADAQMVREVLTAEGVPCTYYKERGVFSAEEVEMLIALFDFLNAPSQHGRLAALLLTPLFNVPLSQLNAKLFKMPEPLMRLLDRWQEYCKSRRWGLLFESVMSETCLAHPQSGDFGFDRRWSATRQILDELLQRAASSALTIADFALALRSWREQDRTGPSGEEKGLRQIENESSSVQIMTMHASKGLEFKAVFLAGGFAPPQKDEDKDEFKRLFYVALTRAEYLLYLPWSQEATHARTKNDETIVSGIGSCGAPLFDGTFLAEGIRTYFQNLEQNPDEKVVAWNDVKTAADASEGTEEAPSKTAAEKAPQIYEVDDVRNHRLHCDSFTSMKNHYSAPTILPEQARALDEDEVMAVEDETDQPPRTTLLPRTSFSGSVFHEIMATLCSGDESKGMTGFAVGNMPRNEALVEDSPLLAIVRRTMSKNALKNRTSPEGDSTEQTLARMAYNALNTPITIGAQPFFLKDISFPNRLAEISFAMDEAGILGEEFSSHREGVFNGAIDLIVRPDGPGGPIYFIDWKTNFLSSYSPSALSKAIQETLYPLQYKLYTLAAARWLGESNLAGLAYLFVRGGEFDSSPSGVYSLPITPEFLADCAATLRTALLAQPQ